MNSFVSPFLADVMLGLMYLVTAVALGVTAYSVWHGMRTRRKGDDIINGVPAGKNSPLIMIGGDETYEARCLDCYEAPEHQERPRLSLVNG